MELVKSELMRVRVEEKEALLRIFSGIGCTWLCRDCVFFIGKEVSLRNGDQSDTNCALMLFELALGIGHGSSYDV